jgi:hypothetical protein
MDAPQKRDRIDCVSRESTGGCRRRRRRARSLFAILFTLIALASPVAASAGDDYPGDGGSDGYCDHYVSYDPDCDAQPRAAWAS